MKSLNKIKNQSKNNNISNITRKALIKIAMKKDEYREYSPSLQRQEAVVAKLNDIIMLIIVVVSALLHWT